MASRGGERAFNSREDLSWSREIRVQCFTGQFSQSRSPSSRFHLLGLWTGRCPSLNRGQFLKADTNGAFFISCQYSLSLNVVFNVFNILDKTFSRSKRLFRAPGGQRQ